MEQGNTSAGPVKVLLVISSGAIGGGETHLLLLLKCLQADKHFSPHVVCHPNGELERVISRMGIPVTLLNLENLLHFPDIFRLGKLIKNLEPHIIHAHLNRGALWSSLLGRFFGRKVVSTAHGLTKAIYYRFSSHVIAVSKAVLEHLSAQLPALREKTTVIHNGIPTKSSVNNERLRQLREQYLIEKDDKIVTVVGKLHPNKGQHTAIRAIKALPPHLHVKLLIVGEGPDENNLRELVTLLSLGPKVTFVPPQPRLYEIYALSDFVIVPSHNEALSMVVLEALRQARPVIASDTGGIPEIIRPGFNGTLVERDNSQALATAIEQGFRDYRRCEKMALSGQKTVTDNFSIERCYLATRNLYLKLLGVPIT